MYAETRRRTLAAALAAVLAVGAPAAAQALTTVVCLGDSLTEGFGIDPEGSYPSQLEARLRALGRDDVRVVNAGVGGASTASLAWRLRWQLRAKPDVLILAIGANDRLRGLPLDATRRNLEAAIETAKRQGVKVVLADMRVPPTYGLRYAREFAAIYPEVARRTGVPLTPFLLEGVAGHRDLTLKDHLHPNAKGYAIVVENVLPTLLSVLDGTRADAGSAARP